MRDLGLENFAAYRAKLAVDPMEWRVLDECCHITISRFFRDKAIFEVLRTRVPPDIAVCAEREARNAQAWSAGCASGEKPYTIKILWDINVARARGQTNPPPRRWRRKQWQRAFTLPKEPSTRRPC
jgi:chemotaxis protein methyltransferase CheR